MHKPHRSLPMQALIQLLDAVAVRGLIRPGLDADALLDQARRRTRLEDFGEGFDEAGFRLLLDGCRDDARLHALGALAARRDVLMMLCNRLRVVDARKRSPGIGQQRIAPPLFITGLPRSGTTFLHRLLAQDPEHRTPATWEMLYPVPPPRTVMATVDRRIAQARRSIWWLHRLAPDFRRIHEVGATLPEECIALMGYSFVSERFPAMYRIPSYERWFDRQSLQGAYTDHQHMLQHLQWRLPASRWLLKAPAHLFALDALFDTYPDARVIQTHRDPARSIASWASFVTTLHGAFSNWVDPTEIGKSVSARWLDAMQRAMRQRKGPRGDHFVDVHYEALLADPLREVRSIYRQLDRPFTAAAEAAMRRFLHGGSSRGSSARHHYAAGDYGLDAVRVRHQFREYIACFGVADEPVERHVSHRRDKTDQRKAA